MKTTFDNDSRRGRSTVVVTFNDGDVGQKQGSGGEKRRNATINSRLW
jgi:hypothetical protein